MVRKPPIDSVDGVSCDCFHIGREYELGNSIGALFLAEGWAEPVPLDAEPAFTPFGADDPYDSHVLYRDRDQPPNLFKEEQPPYLDRDIAQDFRWRRRPRRR